MTKLKKYGGFSAFLLAMAIFLYLGNVAVTYKSEQPESSGETQGVSGSDSDSDFVRSMERKPYYINWESSRLLATMFKLLEQPSSDIMAVFEDKIVKLPDATEYYLGSYQLADHMDCKLLWVSNTSSFSLGADFYGPNSSVVQLESILQEKLGSPDRQESENDQVVSYWLGKRYRDKEYTIICKKRVMPTGEIEWEINIYPQIYH